jgi:hypothetical protein
LTIAVYENYVCNIYLWIFVGIVFRMPQLLTMPSVVPSASRPAEAVAG